MEKKKILYIITKGNFGGAQRYVYDLATSLPRDKFEAVVACGQGDLLKERLKEEKIRVIDLQNSQREINAGKDFKTFRELIKIIRAEKPDVVHLNSSKIGLLGSLVVLYFRILNLFGIWNLKFGIYAVFTSHGWAFNEKHRSWISRLIFYIAHYFTILICNATVAVSVKTKKDVVWMPFIRNKIKVIYNGIAPFKELTKKAASEILAKGDSRIIVYSMSELHPNKGLDAALRGLSLLPDEYRKKIKYYIAGEGEEKNNLEKLARDSGLENQVRFLGFVENAKKLLSGADIFLFPSRTENLPFAVLEAGSAGLPIIATSVGGVPEIIRDMQNGILVHKNNPKEIAEAVMYLIDHPDKAGEFKVEIKKTVSNFFSLDKMVSETIKIY